MDGVLEHYMNRPVDADGQAEYWETMCYPDFHRMYRLKQGKNICKTTIEEREFYACTDGGKTLIDDSDGIISSAWYTVPCFARSKATCPVVLSWLLPDKHGDDYYYQQLVLKVPFRTAAPTDFMSPENTAGTLRQECLHRGIIPSEADGKGVAQVHGPFPKSMHLQCRRGQHCHAALPDTSLQVPTLEPFQRRLWGRLMPVPSTLHNPLHTLNCTAFAIASAVDNIVPKGAGPRAV